MDMIEDLAAEGASRGAGGESRSDRKPRRPDAGRAGRDGHAPCRTRDD